ncbi:malignant fibrous histiocytoma-amplified sequence 1 homolog [Branchiostoma lanceolatum]|uniref:malignant fibrous histiocytoma-amplified sequence 1 homolog n=1 Tax=Branchiostoma lanceolatum TaxID=7740 RepID=UPI003456B828
MHRIPPKVWRLAQLEWLDLRSNPLQMLPAEVGHLTNIKHLDLSNCKLQTLSPELGRLAQLEWLDLRSNPLQTLSAEVGHLTNIKHLDLSNCNLQTLSPELGRLAHLEWLNLRSNMLQTLPAEVGHLTNIKHLDLSNCNLQTLSPELGRLAHLEWLNLRSNMLQTLPAEVGHLSSININDISVSGNPLIKPPIEVCYQGIKAIRQYFEELERSEEKVSARLKVVVLGEKMAGKTSLIQTLQSGESTLTRYEDRTHCVEITQWAPDDNITFEVYDFGGHDVYHLTHQFFLTQDALNLLTVNLQTYNCTEQSYTEAVGFWLDTLNARVPGAVVTLVCSKTDMCSDIEIQEKTKDIQKRFTQQHSMWKRNIQQQLKKLENAKVATGSTDQGEVKQQLERTRQLLTRPLRLTGVCSISSAEPTSGLDTLRSHILETANNTALFPVLRRVLPRTWVDLEQQLRDLRGNGTGRYQSARSTYHNNPLRARLQSHKTKWLTREECLQQGQLAGLMADRLEPVLSYLQQVGTVLRYTDIPELKDLVFYDPSGLIDVIKEIFHHNLEEVFTIGNPRFKDKGFSKTELTNIRETLSSRGFLPREVVIALLGPHATPVGNMDVITNLMEHFGLCYTERSDELDGETSTPIGYCIPWYIQEERTEVINQDIKQQEETEFTVTCEITHFCPRGLFERLSVVVNKLIKSRQDWKDIVVAVREKLPITVYRETKDEYVKIVIKLTIPVQMALATHLCWNVIGPLKDKLLKLLLEWPGLLYRLVLPESIPQSQHQGEIKLYFFFQHEI